MTTLINRYTWEYIRFVVGVSLLVASGIMTTPQLVVTFLKLWLACLHKTFAYTLIR